MQKKKTSCMVKLSILILCIIFFGGCGKITNSSKNTTETNSSKKEITDLDKIKENTQYVGESLDNIDEENISTKEEKLFGYDGTFSYEISQNKIISANWTCNLDFDGTRFQNLLDKIDDSYGVHEIDENNIYKWEYESDHIRSLTCQSNRKIAILRWGTSENNYILPRAKMNTKEAYELATHLTKGDLVEINGDYYYDDLELLTEESKRLESRNFEDQVTSTAIYEKLTYCIEGYFILGNNGWQDYSKYIFDSVPKSEKVFKKKAKKIKNYFVTDSPLRALLKKFGTLYSAAGTINMGSTIKDYDIFISDTKSCAKELHISEEMLGYILAYMDYFGNIEFDTQNSCSIYN